MFTLLIFLLILSVLVLIHEAGHYFVAKRLGVKVEEFGFGFPPRVFGKKIGETIYSINLLPIGGFVKLYGEDEVGGGKIPVQSSKFKVQSKDIKRAFFARPVWQRASIVLAGVIMNFVLAVVIVSYLFAIVGVPTPAKHVIVQAVVSNSPADKAGLKQGDTILALNGEKITETVQLINDTKKHLGETISLQIQDAQNHLKTVMLMPRVKSPASEGAMGVAIAKAKITKYPWYQAPFVGTQEVLNESWLILKGLGQAINQAAVQHQVPKGLAGPIGIEQLTGTFVKEGINSILFWVSVLSLNLAILNVLPIPALDGGRLFFILIEGITGKKVNPQFEAYTHAIGMALLFSLIFFISAREIVLLINHQPLIP